MRSQTVSRSAMMLMVLLAGCKYSGSFLQMNSDAPMPFLGLQLSVQADRAKRERPQHSEGIATTSAAVVAAGAVGEAGAVELKPRGFSRTTSSDHFNEAFTKAGMVAATDASHNTDAAERPASTAVKHNVGLTAVGLVPVSRVTEFQSRVRYSLSEAVTGSTMDAQEVQLRLNGF